MIPIPHRPMLPISLLPPPPPPRRPHVAPVRAMPPAEPLAQPRVRLFDEPLARLHHPARGGRAMHAAHERDVIDAPLVAIRITEEALLAIGQRLERAEEGGLQLLGDRLLQERELRAV